MRGITINCPAKKTICGRGKAHSRTANNFRACATTPVAKPLHRGFLFKQEKTSAAISKTILRSKEHFKSVLVSKRAAYMAAGGSLHLRSTLVMKLVQSLVKHLKTRMVATTTIPKEVNACGQPMQA